MNQPTALDKLTYLLLGEDEELYKKTAQDMWRIKHLQMSLKRVLLKNFKGKRRSEFDEWKEETIQKYKSVITSYEYLEFRDIGKVNEYFAEYKEHIQD